VRGKLSENLLHRSPNYTRKTLRYIQVPSQFSIHMSCSTALLWKKLGLRFLLVLGGEGSDEPIYDRIYSRY
jgi:hypothetical protein